MGQLVLSLFNPSSCLPGRLEPGVLRPYRHVLQREGRRAPTHHTVTFCLHFITQGKDPDTPGYLRGDGVRSDVGDFKSWMRPAFACSLSNFGTVTIPQYRCFSNPNVFSYSKSS